MSDNPYEPSRVEPVPYTHHVPMDARFFDMICLTVAIGLPMILYHLGIWIGALIVRSIP